ncbi:basic amino acid ABC transporter substrate-binding protein [Microaerobacter geothermalis]|uniref:basic amino acid ABC transporter substrate-binding protein n=1 Tax=Microaerobacter geothermalis TaxID=674972 RepID=UPI001F211E91|nr:basic amino acid ABC transporter substrate-binding protein [Microaerobacter geothermalis]MCF6093427.1 basic amino acid ABC transporter substrate-binding protein [Microaerobacter geothermalis]
MRNSKLMVLFILLLGLAVIAIGCGTAKEEAKPAESQKAEGQEQQPAQGPAAEKKVYKVGTDAAYPPFELQGPDGKPVGFDMDIIKAIAEVQGIELDIQHTGWDGLFEGIDKGRVDIGISAITITEDRKQTYDFSDPYFEAYQLIMVPKDSPVEKLADLQGLKIGVQAATTGAIVVEEAFGKTYEGLQAYDDTPAAVEDLLTGRVNAVVADNAVMQDYLKTKPGVADNYKLIKDDSFETEYYGMMVKKGNQEVLDVFNEGLKKIKENGTYDKIYNQYFGEK